MSEGHNSGQVNDSRRRREATPRGWRPRYIRVAQAEKVRRERLRNRQASRSPSLSLCEQRVVLPKERNVPHPTTVQWSQQQYGRSESSNVPIVVNQTEDLQRIPRGCRPWLADPDISIVLPVLLRCNPICLTASFKIEITCIGRTRVRVASAKLSPAHARIVAY
jgi:hypothetical protein